MENCESSPSALDPHKDSAFYLDAAKYWEQVPPTVDGMLGGLSKISDVDLKGSQRFLNSLYQVVGCPGKERALDGGAGIGRVTQGFLMKNFQVVDLVEQDKHFLDQAQQALASTNHRGKFFNLGLQKFTPETSVYDVIWVQWVLGHLTDEDLVSFLKRCKLGLKPKGLIVIKENLTSSGEVEMDHTDSSVTRPPSLLVDLIQKAGLRVIKEQKQQRFPSDLYEVRMFALEPV
uniref:Alpha N-terminal protein methyltransferase 1 n=1 Tax=Scapholeberis mucronata TaxID=202097 RepID=A0A4Y7NKX8_9CRUS|nr:EOG090X0EJQ [Scapholeberis mucronata]SVE93909.1 EOG090X0EJQ [Scapholeberis mucronata]